MTDNTIINKKEKKKINWLYSLAINLAVLLFVLAFTEVLYETNDDFAISRMISDGYPYCRFVNYFVCRVLIFIQGFFAKLNIYMLSQIIAGFVSFVVFIKVLLDRRDNSLEIILAVMIAAFFSVDHYSSIQFTKTAAILMTAGLIWAVDNYTHERSVPAFLRLFSCIMWVSPSGQEVCSLLSAMPVYSCLSGGYSIMKMYSQKTG